MKTIAIIGGGFSGTMSAVNLARFVETPLRVVLINTGRPTGRGTAYGTKRLEHLLNVAARNMSALPDHPAHFVEWLRSRGEYADVPEQMLREMFIPRRLYGDYLCNLSLNYLRPIDARGIVKIEVVEDQAVDVLVSDEARPVVVLANGDSVAADRVLLATGNQPPAAFCGPDGPFAHRAYCPDPWSDWEGGLPQPEHDVVLLGTGLTMVDVFLSLSALGWKGQITAISRHGLLPMSHFKGIEYPDYIPAKDNSPGLSVLARLVEEHCRRLRVLGQNPAIALDKLRPHTQRLWMGLPTEEKREFLKRHAARWNVVRHRIAESVHRQVSQAVADGRLQIVPGTVAGLESREDRVAVLLRQKDGIETALEGAFVINCTGPQCRLSETDDLLLQSLLRRGLARPDELDLGLEISSDFSVIEANGAPSEFLFAIGPLLKGTLWETTAVPELRVQAFRIAQILAGAAVEDADGALSQSGMDLIEYCI